MSTLSKSCLVALCQCLHALPLLPLAFSEGFRPYHLLWQVMATTVSFPHFPCICHLLPTSSALRLNCAEQFHFYMKDAVFQRIIPVPCTTAAERALWLLVSHCSDSTGGWLVYFGWAKTCSQNFYASPGPFPLPSTSPHSCYLSWLCKCSLSWVNYNSKLYSLVWTLK